MADGFGDGEVAIPVRVVGVGVQPVGGFEPIEIVFDVEEIRRIGWGESSLVAQLVEARIEVVHEFVEVALGQIVSFEEVGVVFFLRPVQAPEVAGVLVRPRLARTPDDAEVEVQRARRGHADLVPEKHVHHFVQRELLAAAIALALAGGEFLPLRRKRFAVLILRLKRAAVVELVAETALAGVVTAVRAAQAVVDVVIDFAVIDHRAFPVEGEAGFVHHAVDDLRGQLIAAIEPRRALGQIRIARDEGEDGQGLQRGGGELEVVRHVVVNEAGEVQ